MAKKNNKPEVSQAEETEVPQLNEAQKRFCQEYVLDFNATRAYSVAYPKEKTNDTIRANASNLLTKPNIRLIRATE